MRVEANAWLCMAARYRAKPWLNGLVASDFTKFVDYILGDRVYGIQLPSSTTEFSQRVKPDWSIVLAYEFKLRREVMKLITQHARTMSEALTMVTKDADLKEAFYTTPIALKAAGALEQQPIKYHKGDYKGDYKGPYFKGSGKKGQKGKKVRYLRLSRAYNWYGALLTIVICVLHGMRATSVMIDAVVCTNAE